MTPAELVTRWRRDAEVLSGYDERLARVVEQHAAALEAALRDDGAEPLTLGAAARESGYSADRLRHMVSDGQIPNAGKKGAPRVRRADLPRKARRSTGFDAAASARLFVHGGRDA